ncbi:Rrf2 family transcriptional regulator [Brevundimonas vesicularis]|uniref:Rrf2 family transcriptional regulator n=1 Tax=Brevundimonas vesicularis TaxID=41276 RepID=UPI0038D47C1F
MSDSQRFPVAAHALAYLAHKGAFTAADAAPSAVLAASVPTNPVVIRRVTALLAKAGLIATRPGASGGSWLLREPQTIRLDEVLRAVNGCAHLGSPPAGAKGCPVGEHIPRQVAKALTAADQAAGEALSKITIADLLESDPASLKGLDPHASCAAVLAQ